MVKTKKLIYDPKFVCSHRPMSHQKTNFHVIILLKLIKILILYWKKMCLLKGDIQLLYTQTNGSDYTVEDIISEEYLHVITDKKDEV